MQRGPSLSDHLEVGLVLGIIEAAKFTIIDAEPVNPDMEDSLLCRGIASGGRNGAWGRIPDTAALDAIATKCVAPTTESSGRAGSGGRFVFGLLRIPV